MPSYFWGAPGKDFSGFFFSCSSRKQFENYKLLTMSDTSPLIYSTNAYSTQPFGFFDISPMRQIHPSPPTPDIPPGITCPNAWNNPFGPTQTITDWCIWKVPWSRGNEYSSRWLCCMVSMISSYTSFPSRYPKRRGSPCLHLSFVSSSPVFVMMSTNQLDYHLNETG